MEKRVKMTQCLWNSSVNNGGLSVISGMLMFHVMPKYIIWEKKKAARILRYQVFADVAGQDRNVRIALAHHMEDNAETMLFQLIRGSGLDGLCGMRPQRTGTNGEIYIRPFLQCSREQIEQFLEEQGAGILYGQYQCQRVLQQKPDAKEGASGTDTDESAGGTAYADGDGTAAAGKRLSGRRDGFPGEKNLFPGRGKM